MNSNPASIKHSYIEHHCNVSTQQIFKNSVLIMDDTRSVRRRLNPNIVTDVTNDEVCLPLDSVSILCGARLADYCSGRRPAQYEIFQSNNRFLSITSFQENFLKRIDSQINELYSWASQGLLPFTGLSAQRREKWNSYYDSEKWIYYATYLMSNILKWTTTGLNCSFLWNIDKEEQVPSDCYMQIAWMLTLAKRWNVCPMRRNLLPIQLVWFVSIEHWWFGYVTNINNESKVVHMSFDEAPEDNRLIVNRLESSEDLNDFDCIAYQNTLLKEAPTEGAAMSVVSEQDLCCLLLSRYVGLLVAQYTQLQQLGEEALPVDSTGSTDSTTNTESITTANTINHATDVTITNNTADTTTNNTNTTTMNNSATNTTTSNSSSSSELLLFLQREIWEYIEYMRCSIQVTHCIDASCSWDIGNALAKGVPPLPTSDTTSTTTSTASDAAVDTKNNQPYATKFAALAAAVALNPANYQARRALVEAYIDIGEHYLAHQHCLYLLEQLAPHIGEESYEAPIACTAHSYAVELVDTVLQEIHHLYERNEEGYEQLSSVDIPCVGSQVQVEWALDDELVLYPGVVSVHPDGRSLCIAYDDDECAGQHRRRFESSLHLVNINDPSDQYLEKYFLTESSDSSVEIV